MRQTQLPIAVVDDRIVPNDAAPSRATPRAVDPDALRELIGGLEVGALIVDATGRMVCANRAAQQLFGERVLQGRMVEELLPPNLRDAHRVYRSVYGTMPTARPMGRYPYLLAQHDSGEAFCVQIELTPFITDSGLWTAALIEPAAPEDC